MYKLFIGHLLIIDYYLTSFSGFGEKDYRSIGDGQILAC